MRRIQNKVAESRRTLPLAILYSVAIWLVAGLISKQWWIQLALFLLSTYLMMHMNNINVLIRIFSRMVSVSFIVLSTSAVFLFPSINGSFVQLCFIASLLSFYNCYQDTESPGWTFYAFLCLGMGSIVEIHIYFLADDDYHRLFPLLAQLSGLVGRDADSLLVLDTLDALAPQW